MDQSKSAQLQYIPHVVKPGRLLLYPAGGAHGTVGEVHAAGGDMTDLDPLTLADKHHVVVADDVAATDGLEADAFTGARAGVAVTQRSAGTRALPLARLDALLAQAWDHRLTLIVAPAGSGKSTLLTRFVDGAPGRVES